MHPCRLTQQVLPTLVGLIRWNLGNFNSDPILQQRVVRREHYRRIFRLTPICRFVNPIAARKFVAPASRRWPKQNQHVKMLYFEKIENTWVKVKKIWIWKHQWSQSFPVILEIRKVHRILTESVFDCFTDCEADEIPSEHISFKPKNRDLWIEERRKNTL